MTATDTQPVDVPEDDWRGRVTDSQNDDLPIDARPVPCSARCCGPTV
jgi:hypothetical protein